MKTTLSYNDPTTTTIRLKERLPLDYISLSSSSSYIQHHLYHSLINNPVFFSRIISFTKKNKLATQIQIHHRNKKPEK